MPPATIIDWKKTVVNRKNALKHAYPPGRHFMSAGRRSQLCAGQQDAGRHGPAEAAGRAEQRDAPAGHGVRSASDSLISITGPFVISAPLPFAVFPLNNPR